MNLIEGLQAEIKRVNEIAKVYDELPAGVFASAMMKGDIIIAEKAIANMDTIAMLVAIENLREYQL